VPDRRSPDSLRPWDATGTKFHRCRRAARRARGQVHGPRLDCVRERYQSVRRESSSLIRAGQPFVTEPGWRQIQPNLEQRCPQKARGADHAARADHAPRLQRMPWQSHQRHRARHRSDRRRTGISRNGLSEDRTDRVSTQCGVLWPEKAAGPMCPPFGDNDRASGKLTTRGTGPPSRRIGLRKYCGELNLFCTRERC